MTLLSFNNKYLITSATTATTGSSSFVDDSQASQSFELSTAKTVLVIYQAHNNHGADEYTLGKKIAISVDSNDKAVAWSSPRGSNYANSVITFWMGTLTAGSHTIKGRFASPYAQTVTISERVLLIYILNGDEFQYTDNSSSSATTSTSFVNDTNACHTFTPSSPCKALMLYNASNSKGVTETPYGKKIAINLADTDYSQAENSPAQANASNSVFTASFAGLSAQSFTVRGRFASLGSGSHTVTITRRQFAVLLIADSTAMDVRGYLNQVSTTSNYPVDDSYAVIDRTTNDTREVLVVAMGTKRSGTTSSVSGEAYGIKIDTNDRVKARNSPYSNGFANSAATVYSETLSAGSHTIKGRFGNNTGSDSAVIDARMLIVAWFSTAQPVTKSHTTNSTVKGYVQKTHKTDTIIKDRGLWAAKDTNLAAKLNKSFNTGLDCTKGLPTTIGEAYLATDTKLLYISLNGSTWDSTYAKSVANGLVNLDGGGRVSQSNSYLPTLVQQSYTLGTVYQNGSRPRLLLVYTYSDTAGTVVTVYIKSTNPPDTVSIENQCVNASDGLLVMDYIPPNYYYKVSWSAGTGTLFKWWEMPL